MTHKFLNFYADKIFSSISILSEFAGFGSRTLSIKCHSSAFCIESLARFRCEVAFNARELFRMINQGFEVTDYAPCIECCVLSSSLSFSESLASYQITVVGWTPLIISFELERALFAVLHSHFDNLRRFFLFQVRATWKKAKDDYRRLGWGGSEIQSAASLLNSWFTY